MPKQRFSKFKFKNPFWGGVEIFAYHKFKTPSFLGISRTAWTPPPFATSGTVQLFFSFFLRVFIVSCKKLYHARGPSLMISAWLIPSSTQLRTAAHSSASSAAKRRAVPFPRVPCRALPCGPVLCGAVRWCTVLCRAVHGQCFAVLDLTLFNHNKNAPPVQLSPHIYIAHHEGVALWDP